MRERKGIGLAGMSFKIVTTNSKHTLEFVFPSCFLDGISRRITYFVISSSLVRLKSLRILLARFGPSLFGTEVSVRPGISASPFWVTTRERAAMSCSI